MISMDFLTVFEELYMNSAKVNFVSGSAIVEFNFVNGSLRVRMPQGNTNLEIYKETVFIPVSP